MKAVHVIYVGVEHIPPENLERVMSNIQESSCTEDDVIYYVIPDYDHRTTRIDIHFPEDEEKLNKIIQLLEDKNELT